MGLVEDQKGREAIKRCKLFYSLIWVLYDDPKKTNEHQICHWYRGNFFPYVEKC